MNSYQNELSSKIGLSYHNIVILTGAGISAESGLSTFRREDGLWEQHAIEDVATPEGYAQDPNRVQSFYNKRRRELLSQEVNPNKAHLALAQLEQELNGKVTIITQNIDNLHEKAGNKNVLHMHGELLKARCPQTNQLIAIEQDLHEGDLCHCCSLPTQLRPHIVWFGEMPLFMNQIHGLLEQADLFISIGTSGVVYPAAGFVRDATLAGADTIEINLEPSAVQSEFKTTRYGNATQLVPELVDEILAQQNK